jgi:hypothetical protein
MNMTSSVAESAACKGTTSSGFSKVNKHLRSVLMSPTSLYLFAALNSANLTADETSRIQDLFERDLPVLTDTHDGNLLINAMNAADGDGASSSSSPSPSKKAKTAKETLITTALEESLSEALKKPAAKNAEESDVAALSEWHVQHPNQPNIQRKAQIDLVVYDKNNQWIDDREEKLRCYDAYAYMEIGICPQEDEACLLGMWWEKMDQLLNYLNAVCVEKYRGAARGKGKLGTRPGVPFPKHPVILSVLVLSKSRETSAIGTFVLEWCGTSNKFRMALLSAELCRDKKTTSAAFGKVISLIRVLTDLRQENLGEGGKKLAKDVWRYLGPDCAKFGESKVS